MASVGRVRLGVLRSELLGGQGGNGTPETYRFAGGTFVPITGYPTVYQTTYVAFSAADDPAATLKQVTVVRYQ